MFISSVYRTEDPVETADPEVSGAPGGSNARRPQYTSITRDRPATEPPLPEDDLAPANRLNYVTIERVRPTTPETSLKSVGTDGVETDAADGLQYVTLRRSSVRPTQSPEESVVDESPNLIAVDSNSFRSRPQRVQSSSEPTTRATSTTTTTPRPARIIVPQVLLEPVTPNVNNRLLLDPRSRHRTRQPPEVRTEVDEVTLRTRVSARRSTTVQPPVPVSESTTELLPFDDYLLEYDYLYDENLNPVPTTESDAAVLTETTISSVNDILSNLDQTDLRIEHSPNEKLPVETSEDDLHVEGREVTTEVTPAKTTINLLANFQALTSPRPDAEGFSENVEPKTFEKSR